MDAFEQVVSEILWRQGYWIQRNVKVELSADQKKGIGRPSSPRWELDVVAYNGRDNTLRVVECKSYLDSLGVRYCAFVESVKGYETHSKRYKLFNEPMTRRIVFDRLRQQLSESGACRGDAEVKLSLACGKVKRVIATNYIRTFKRTVGIFGTKSGCGTVLWSWQAEAMKIKFPRLLRSSS